MAGVVAPGQSTPEARRGSKRPGDASLESEQRLSKRFDLLNLENGTRLYMPVPGSSSTLTPPTDRHAPAVPLPASKQKKRARPRPPPPDDCMLVEDTPNRVYIADLDAELSDIESDEDNPIFLQDIEKHLAKIPKHLLVGPDPKPTKDNQLILYNVPSSLTVPESQDSVRKAIVEARGRIRDRQTNASTKASERGNTAVATPEAAPETQIPPPSPGGDEMEID